MSPSPKKLLKRHLNFEVDRSLVRKWGKWFHCPYLKSKEVTTLSMCNARPCLAKEHAAYEPCVDCPIRRHSFRVLRKPRLGFRIPRTTDVDE